MPARNWILVVLSIFVLGACGITAGRGAGYARLPAPDDTHRVMGLSLGPLPLRLARVIVRDEDPEAARILKGLRGVRVFIYETQPGFSPASLNETVSSLRQKGWDPVVAIREDGEAVNVLVKFDQAEHIRGMVVMSADSGELVMVNLMGRLEPEMFNAYMGELDITTPQIVIEG
ncbi:MAG: DUF4252 domain-containing protein [Pseudomonadota bacterium]